MRREPPVRIREGLGVKFPRATRLVMGFSREEDARRVMAVFPKRFEKYGLDDPPRKDTAGAVRAAPDRPSQATSDASTSGTFDLLGFTHYWGRSRRGYWVVKRKTSKSRLRRGLVAIAMVPNEPA